MIPETKYARSGTIHIAYHVFGKGPIDLVIMPGWASNIEVYWEEPTVARFLERLAAFARVILFDKRGSGLSDRVTDTPTLEERIDDLRAIFEAIGSERAARLGYSEGGPMCAFYAATYPERTIALIMIGSYPRIVTSEDWPWGRSPQDHQALLDQVSNEWGGPVGLSVRAPSMMNDERFRRWWAKYLRASASPATMQAFINMTAEIDIRPVLPSIQVPTLLIHATGDRSVPVECSRYMVDRIPDAKLIELPTEDHLPFIGCPEEILNEVEQFLTGSHTSAESQRVLATVMFTDIVDSTSINAQLGDVRWRDLLEAHNTVIRQELAVYRGQEMNTTGDGFYATFDGPARAIQCACAISAQMQTLNLPIRAGIHTGECVITGDTVEGIAVHIGARVAATAGANQVVVSQTVKDLVVGSGIDFDDHGVHVLKGVPDQWHLYSVKSV